MRKELVVIENNQVLTDSRIVAEQFGKNHKDVMRDVRNLMAQLEDERKIAPMFIETTYSDKYGRTKPQYLMNRDGFSLLAMGFTGKKALQFKLNFIDAFKRMEEQLKARTAQPQLERDPRWIETRRLGKKTRKLLTQAIQALEEYFNARGTFFPAGYIYGHLTNVIQNALGIEKGSRDSLTVKKLNQLDQAEDIAGGTIFTNIASGYIRSLAEIDALILSQLRQLNSLLSGQLFLPAYL